MAHDFWNHNLHPITMYKSQSQSNAITRWNIGKKNNYLKADELEGLVSSNELILELGIGAKKIKALYALLGEVPKYNKAQTYYKSALIPRIKELIAKDKVEIDLSGYISNYDLMNMFSFSKYKAWEIAKKEGLVKRKFSGCQNYYEREKAIESFSKYKR